MGDPGFVRPVFAHGFGPQAPLRGRRSPWREDCRGRRAGARSAAKVGRRHFGEAPVASRHRRGRRRAVADGGGRVGFAPLRPAAGRRPAPARLPVEKLLGRWRACAASGGIRLHLSPGRRRTDTLAVAGVSCRRIFLLRAFLFLAARPRCLLSREGREWQARGPQAGRGREGRAQHPLVKRAPPEGPPTGRVFAERVFGFARFSRIPHGGHAARRHAPSSAWRTGCALGMRRVCIRFAGCIRSAREDSARPTSERRRRRGCVKSERHLAGLRCRTQNSVCCGEGGFR